MSDLNLSPIPLPAVAAGEPGSDLRIGDGTIRRTILPGGTRVITEKMAGTHAASIGMWVARGSRDEVEGAFGSTHFLEHLLFKGTTRRTAHEIAMAFDVVGGDSNAGTSREHTHYYAEVLGEDLPMAVEVLLDMISSPLLDAADFEMERGIIVNELTMSLDSPKRLAFDEFTRRVFPNHPLGRLIGGTVESVQADTLEGVIAHYQAGYTPDGLVVAAAGDVNHDQVCELVSKFIHRPDSPWPQWQSIPNPHTPARDFSANVTAPLPAKVHRDDITSGASGIAWEPESGIFRPHGQFEQSRVIIGGPGPAYGAPEIDALNVLNVVLGGGMSSRLFQNIREKRGLAYTTYVFNTPYRDAGTFGVTATCNPDNVEEVSKLLHAELEEIATNTIPEDELERAKGQLRGSTLLSLEDNGLRADILATAEIMRGIYRPMELKMQRMQRVTSAEVRDLAAKLVAQATIEVRLEPED